MDKYVPPFKLTPKILDLSTRIAALIGRYEGLNLPLPKIQLRKENRIKTIHGTVAIEGNTLTVEQVTALLEGKPVIGSARKEYIQLFKTLSTATASRDLKLGVESHRLVRYGDKRNALYSFKGEK